SPPSKPGASSTNSASHPATPPPCSTPCTSSPCTNKTPATPPNQQQPDDYHTPSTQPDQPQPGRKNPIGAFEPVIYPIRGAFTARAQVRHKFTTCRAGTVSIMTTTLPAPELVDPALPVQTRKRPRWVRPSVALMLVSTAALYLWNIAESGWGNGFYEMAVQAGTWDW